MSATQQELGRLWWGPRQYIGVLIVTLGLIFLGLVTASLIMAEAADRPSSGSKFVLHVTTSTCDDIASVFPAIAIEHDALLNPRDRLFRLSPVSCDESNDSAFSIYVTDEFISRVGGVYLIPDELDTGNHFIITASHPQRVDFDHTWLGTLDLTNETATHQPPKEHPHLMARISDRQDCDGFRLFPRDCGTEWAHTDLRTFATIP